MGETGWSRMMKRSVFVFNLRLNTICDLVGDWFEAGTGGHVQEQVEGKGKEKTSG